jgi:VanZ family protein
VSAVNSGASGALWVDNIEVFPAQQKQTFLWWRLFFGGLWLATVTYGVCRIRLWQWDFGALILVVTFVLVLGLLVPSSTISNVAQREEAVSGTLLKGAKTLSRFARSSLTSTEQPPIKSERPEAAEKTGSDRSAEMKRDSLTKHVTFLKEMGHFMLFAILAFVSFVSLDRRLSQGSRAQQAVVFAESSVVERSKTNMYSLLMLGLGLIVFSAATEVLQFLTLTRAPGIKDWVFDLAGIGFAFLFFLAYRYIRLRVRAKIDSQNWRPDLG